MRKELIERLAGLLCVLVLAGCGDAVPLKTITNKEFGFQIKYPESWTTEDWGKKVPFSVNSPVAAGAEEKCFVDIHVEDVDAGTTLKDATEHRITGIKKLVKNYELGAVEEVNLSGLAARKITFYMDPLNSHGRGKTVVILLIVGKCEFKIYASAQKSDWDFYATDIDAIVKSFKLIEPK